MSDIAFLATLPRLKQAMFLVEKWQSAQEFLARYGPEVPEIKAARTALAAVGVKDIPIRRIFVDGDHHLHLDLEGHPLDDLEPLRGLPIAELSLKNGKARDLMPLRGMPLTKLSLAGLHVDDLEPLRGMQIIVLSLRLENGKKIASLGPLQGMPITDLALSGLPNDLGPLRGAPLVHVNLHGSLVQNVGILADFPDLETIVLPDGPTNVEALHALPKLRLLSETSDGSDRPAQSAAQFWKEHDAQHVADHK